MHDPMTVAFEIKSLITIWHVDPEKDGSDDSCGWSAPKLTVADRALVKELVDGEMRHPYYFAQPPIHEERTYPRMDDETMTETFQCYRVSPGDCAALVTELFRVFSWRLHRRWTLTPKLLAHAMSLGTAEHDNFQSSFTFWEDEALRPDRRRDKVERTFCNVLRNYRRVLRPWYRHPRWHLHHWQIQFHPVQTFKRWAFTRCADCGGGFAWGESGVGTWSSDGPQWFRSENLRHTDCPPRHIRTEGKAAA